MEGRRRSSSMILLPQAGRTKSRLMTCGHGFVLRLKRQSLGTETQTRSITGPNFFAEAVDVGGGGDQPEAREHRLLERPENSLAAPVRPPVGGPSDDVAYCVTTPHRTDCARGEYRSTV